MKFIVKKDIFGEVEVKLHYETKNKIKRIAGLIAMPVIVYVAAYAHQKKMIDKIDQ